MPNMRRCMLNVSTGVIHPTVDGTNLLCIHKKVKLSQAQLLPPDADLRFLTVCRWGR